MNHKSAQVRLSEILARQQALATEIKNATNSKKLEIRDELVKLDDERLQILKEIQAADPYLVERADANLDTQDIIWVTKEGTGRLECPINPQQKYFPLSGLPTRKFNLGDRVQATYPDGVLDITYLFKGTIFGCEYHHPIWAESSSLALRHCSGWVYMVVWNWSVGQSNSLTLPSSSCRSRLEVDYCTEDELSLIEDLEEAPVLGLQPETVQYLFSANPQLSELLQYCSVTLVGNSNCELHVSIDCPSKEIADLLKKMRGSLEVALKALDLVEEEAKIGIH